MEAIELKKLIARELSKDEHIYMVYNLKGSYLKVIPMDVPYNCRYEPLINFKNGDKFYIVGYKYIGLNCIYMYFLVIPSLFVYFDYSFVSNLLFIVQESIQLCLQFFTFGQV